MNRCKHPITNEPRLEFERRFRRSGDLTKRKLLEYIPALLLTNLSSLLLISVDGIVVGNFLGSGALSAVNVFYPVTMFIGVVSVLIANGAAAILSTRMGRSDREGLLYAKSAVMRVLILSMLFVGVAQIPVAWGIIRSCHLSPEMHMLTCQYAVGILISMPFGLGSTVGVCQLQTIGRMKVLMWLSIMEAIANLLLDLLFVGVLKMGVAGAGLGTAGANILRFLATELYLAKKTDIYYSGGVKARREDYREIITCGLPEASHSVMMAIQNYFMIRIILSVFGDEGGVIKGVCVFCFSLTNVLISGVQGSMRPLAGIVTGAKDRVGMRILMRQSFILMTIFSGVMMLLIELFPGWFFWLHGVSVIPAGGVLSVRLYTMYFCLRAYNAIFRLCFSIRGDVKYATVLTVVSNAALPVFAFVLSRIFPGPFLWLSYPMTELVLFILNLRRYRFEGKKEREEDDPAARILYLTVKTNEAVQASRQIRCWAEDNGYPARLANRVSLCMEEMVTYAVASQGREDINIQIMVRFTPDGACFSMLDDGRCIALDKDVKTQELITDNYGLLKKVARSVEYQYILNMNYSVFNF